MKYLLIITALVIFIYCSINIQKVVVAPEPWNQSETKNETLNKLEQKEYLTGIRNDIIFMNLAFGMTEEETLKKFRQYEKSDLVSNIKEQQGILGASYTLDYNDCLNKGKLFCFFNNNKLNELQIDTICNPGNNILDLFLKKYGECDYYAENSSSREYHWINGNRHLAIYHSMITNQLLIQYKDTSGAIEEAEATRLAALHRA
jgi:hypothetical protein